MGFLVVAFAFGVAIASSSDCLVVVPDSMLRQVVIVDTLRGTLVWKSARDLAKLLRPDGIFSSKGDLLLLRPVIRIKFAQVDSLGESRIKWISVKRERILGGNVSYVSEKGESSVLWGEISESM